MPEATGNGDLQIPREGRIRTFLKSLGSKLSKGRETSVSQPDKVLQPEPEPIQAQTKESKSI